MLFSKTPTCLSSSWGLKVQLVKLNMFRFCNFKVATTSPITLDVFGSSSLALHFNSC